jgi:hypothetical protein
MTKLRRTLAQNAIRGVAEFHETTWPDWYKYGSNGSLRLREGLAFENLHLERVATCLDNIGEAGMARLPRTLRAILIDTTRKAFRDDAPKERTARLEKPWEEEIIA